MTHKDRAAGRRFRLSKVVMVLLFLLGVGLLLYPTVADQINASVNRGAIDRYEQHVQALDESACQAMLAAAQAYNEELYQGMPYITDLASDRREVYESLLDMTGTGILGYIEIQKLGMYLAIYHGTSESVLQTGVGHLEGSSLPVPGQSVHTVLSGHSGLPSARLFTDLDQMAVGDTFRIHVLNQVLTYQVERIRRVLPDELEQLRIEEGQELCTLMTCTPYGINTHRLVLTGRRVQDTRPETPGATEPAPTEATAKPPLQRLLSSTWDRWFLLLPAVVLTLAWGVTFYVRGRRRKKRMAAEQPEGKEGKPE